MSDNIFGHVFRRREGEKYYDADEGENCISQSFNGLTLINFLTHRVFKLFLKRSQSISSHSRLSAGFLEALIWCGPKLHKVLTFGIKALSFEHIVCHGTKVLYDFCDIALFVKLKQILRYLQTR